MTQQNTPQSRSCKPTCESVQSCVSHTLRVSTLRAVLSLCVPAWIQVLTGTCLSQQLDGSFGSPAESTAIDPCGRSLSSLRIYENNMIHDRKVKWDKSRINNWLQNVIWIQCKSSQASRFDYNLPVKDLNVHWMSILWASQYNVLYLPSLT